MADFPVQDLGAAQWDAWLDSYYERFRPAFEKSVYPKLKAFRDFSFGYQGAADDPTPIFRRRRA